MDFYLCSKRIKKEFKFRKDINALRAIALLMVVINHIDKSLLPSGYLGVDIFFVISGFVVTLSFLKSGENSLSPKLLILNFYERRFKRLFPALIIFIFFNFIFYTIFINPYTLITKSELNSAIASLLGVSNFYFLKSQLSYFGDEFSYNPFLHTWSLGVEEQFYFLFPFIFIFILKISKGSIKKVLSFNIFIFLLSLCSFFYANQNLNSSIGFFFSPFRFWEMILGSITYFLSSYLNFNSKYTKIINTFSIIGIIGISLVPSISFSPNLVFLICILTAINIISFDNSGILSKLINIKYIQLIGYASYSIYLYHWPLIVYSKWLFPSNNYAPIFFGILSIPLGFLSYFFIELKFIKNDIVIFTFMPNNLRRIFFFIVPSILIFGISNLSFKIYNFISKYNIAYLSSALKTKNLKCDLSNKKEISSNLNKSFNRLILYGDSHATHLLTMAEKALKERNFNIQVVDDLLIGNKSCDGKQIRKLIDYLELRNGDLFVTSFHRGRLSMNELATTGDRADVYHWDPDKELIANSKTKKVIQNLVLLGIELDKKGIPLIMTFDTPTSMVQLNTNMCNLSASLGRKSPCRVETSVDLNSRKRQEYVIFEVLKELSDKNIKVYSFDPYKFLSKGRKMFEPFNINGQPIFHDGHHLTDEGALIISKYFRLFLKNNNFY